VSIAILDKIFIILVNKLSKILGLYLYTLIIGHKSCKMFSIVNELTLQNKLQNFVTNNVFLDKKKKTQQQQNKKEKKNRCRDREMKSSCTQSIVYTHGLTDNNVVTSPSMYRMHPKRMRYRCTTESTESIDCSQAI